MSHYLNQLPNTHVHELHDPITDRKYKIWVDQPLSLENNQKKWPVIFVANVEYAFPIIRSVQSRLKENGEKIGDFILVGIPGRQSKMPNAKTRSKHPHNLFGEEEKGPGAYIAEFILPDLRRNITQQILPFVARNYPADMNHKIYLGYAFGCLLGTSILLSKPWIFDKYILSSPSHWLDQNIITELENQYAQKYQDLPATVMIYEMSNPSSHPNSGGYNLLDALPNMANLKLQLELRNYPRLKIHR